MSTDIDGQSPKHSPSIVMDVRKQVHTVRDRYNAELTNGAVGGETRRLLARLVMTYHGALREFRDHEAVKDDWNADDSVVSQITQLRGQTTTVAESIPGATAATRQRTVPAIQQVSADRLVEMTHALDDIANELGFAEDVKDRTPHTEASMDDLRGLLKTRGQTQALENLPGSTEADS